MKKKRFSAEEIVKILREAEGGRSVADACRKYNVSEQSFYRWKKKYGGMDIDEAKRAKALEQENARLKRMVADLMLDNELLRAVNAKKW